MLIYLVIGDDAPVITICMQDSTNYHILCLIAMGIINCQGSVRTIVTGEQVIPRIGKGVVNC